MWFHIFENMHIQGSLPESKKGNLRLNALHVYPQPSLVIAAFLSCSFAIVVTYFFLYNDTSVKVRINSHCLYKMLPN